MGDKKSEIDQMWYDWFVTDAFKAEKRMTHFLGSLPHDPRCKFCGTPFKGVGGSFVRILLGRKQSYLNPRFCNMCDDFAKKNTGGHEVDMAMLFADIRGSTELSEQMSPTKFSHLINRFYVEATNAIIDEDGLVEKLAGDAVAAFWGAGIAGPNYVARTIQAAQTMQKNFDQLEIPVGIGVHSGVAYFGAMGSADGMVNITAIGDEVNLAARLASKADAGEIVISDFALNKAGMDGNGLESRRLELKGISELVDVKVIKISRS